MRRVRRAGAVVFDCDSTLTTIEGIEALAGEHHEEVERLTQAAMDGTVPLEEVYGLRLERVQPTREDVAGLAARYIDALVPDAREVISALQAEGIAIRVISGGLLPAVLGLAQALGIPNSDVAAVDIRFDAAGRYAGYDERSPLARAGGKAEVLARWRHELPPPLVFVGDGITDLEAKDTVDLFVAYAGVVERSPVVKDADMVVRSPSLAPILAIALGGEPPKDPRMHALFRKGRDLLESDDRAGIA
jgi:phosphoserine phosphatase